MSATCRTAVYQRICCAEKLPPASNLQDHQSFVIKIFANATWSWRPVKAGIQTWEGAVGPMGRRESERESEWASNTSTHRARHGFHMQQNLTFQDCKSTNENKNEFIGHTTSSLSRHLTNHVSDFSVIRKHLNMQTQLPLLIRKNLIDNTEIMKRSSYKKMFENIRNTLNKKQTFLQWSLFLNGAKFRN